ncbi:DUF3823 domain-containing protein [Dysgonomonas gadei]|uniref:DUF3823 domain-containing protein n=1 Tax=Dysgonomonas gadei ATCC BAA-286 TaxID=742766 RepID=F5ITB9_9BACT|nr:DUF3823 domain-containing protein [Dysgonomonas gadei]EGJ99303.1 hypothetical protein HMPREF9455_00336 [Dysgonomonas gadei ATCC BAA-286]
MRNTILYIALSLLMILGMASCADDNYPEPKETFRGKFVEKGTNKPFQTAIGNTGVRIRMMEYSWSDTPQPYDFNCKMDGTFNNTKVFKGEYGVIPSGAFVPLTEEKMTISGTVEKTYEVEPILKIEWDGEPVVNADRTVTVKVKVAYGSDNTTYQKPLVEGWLFISETDYVGDFSYSPNYSVKCDPAKMGVGASEILGPNGTTFTINTSSASKSFPDYARKYFIRFGVRTSVTFDATNRYNYTEVKEVSIPAS